MKRFALYAALAVAAFVCVAVAAEAAHAGAGEEYEPGDPQRTPVDCKGNASPVADAGDNFDSAGAAYVEVSAGGSYDIDSDANDLKYHWILDSVPTHSKLTNADLDHRNRMVASFAPDVKGFYFLTVYVEDECSASRASVRVHVLKAGAQHHECKHMPKPHALIQHSRVIPAAVGNVRLFGGNSYSGDGHGLHHEWSVSSGDDDVEVAHPRAEEAVFKANPGDYTVTLKVIDRCGHHSTAHAKVHVQDHGVVHKTHHKKHCHGNYTPRVSAGDDLILDAPGDIHLNGHGVDYNGDKIHYQWQIIRPHKGHDVVSHAATGHKQHLAKGGLYIFALTGDDTCGSRTDTIHVYVKDKPVDLSGTITIAVDNYYTLYFNGQKIGPANPTVGWTTSISYPVTGSGGHKNVVAVEGRDVGVIAGIMAEVRFGTKAWETDSTTWKCFRGAKPADWTKPTFDDSKWPAAGVTGANGASPWNRRLPIGNNAKWIWAAPPKVHETIYCRLAFDLPTNDKDMDGVTDDKDNCPDKFNPSQADEDKNGKGDACDVKQIIGRMVWESRYSPSVANKNELDAFKKNWEGAKAQAGYCRKAFSNWSRHAGIKNGFCPSGSNRNFAARVTVDFYEPSPSGATWEIGFGMDFGRGFNAYIDGEQVARYTANHWWAGNNGLRVIGGRHVNQGHHLLEIFGNEDCCDGATETVFRRNKGAWTVFTTSALQQVMNTPQTSH